MLDVKEFMAMLIHVMNNTIPHLSGSDTMSLSHLFHVIDKNKEENISPSRRVQRHGSALGKANLCLEWPRIFRYDHHPVGQPKTAQVDMKNPPKWQKNDLVSGGHGQAGSLRGP